METLNRTALKIIAATDVPPQIPSGVLNLRTPGRDLPPRRPEMLSQRGFVMENSPRTDPDSHKKP